MPAIRQAPNGSVHLGYQASPNEDYKYHCGTDPGGPDTGLPFNPGKITCLVCMEDFGARPVPPDSLLWKKLSDPPRYIAYRCLEHTASHYCGTWVRLDCGLVIAPHTTGWVHHMQPGRVNCLSCLAGA